jgi:hypothetical protein
MSTTFGNLFSNITRTTQPTLPSAQPVAGSTVPGTGPLPSLRSQTGIPSAGASTVDPVLRPYLGLGLQRAEQLFFGQPQPSLYPGQMYVSPSMQTMDALQRQEEIARQGAGVLGAGQQAYLQGLTSPAVSSPLFASLYGSGGQQVGSDVYRQAAAGGMSPSTGRFEQLYGQAGAGVPSIYGQVAGGQGAIDTSYLGNLAQQAGIQPASGLYSQVAGGGFQNAAMSPTAQTAMGGFLQGSPYQQQMIQAATRPLVQQFSEQVIPGISSQFSAAGRYGSGAMQRAQGQATESFGRALGDVTSGIVGQDYARERAFQEAAIGQLAGLSQQDLANRLAGAGALESSMRAGIGQQAGLFGQGAGIQQQNLATQLAAAGAGESARQSQLAQQAGLAEQLANMQQQGIATQFAGAGGLEQSQQAAFARQLQAASGLAGSEETALDRMLRGSGAAGTIYGQQYLPSEQLAQIGASQEAIAARPLQEAISRYQFQQQLPYSQLQSFLSSVYGNPMAGSNVPQQAAAQTSRLGTTLGGAALGAGIGSMIPGGAFGFSPSQTVAGGAALGGLLGGFF